jgi:small subunit ribosomal protein S20
MRTEIKRFRSLVSEKKLDEARALLPSVFSVIDKTAQKGVIHSNAAARYKSRLAKSLE